MLVDSSVLSYGLYPFVGHVREVGVAVALGCHYNARVLRGLVVVGTVPEEWLGGGPTVVDALKLNVTDLCLYDDGTGGRWCGVVDLE